jgi:hypothetical protein
MAVSTTLDLLQQSLKDYRTENSDGHSCDRLCRFRWIQSAVTCTRLDRCCSPGALRDYGARSVVMERRRYLGDHESSREKRVKLHEYRAV